MNKKWWAYTTLRASVLLTSTSDNTEFNFTYCVLFVKNEWYQLIKKGLTFKLTNFSSRICGCIYIYIYISSLAYATGLSRCFRTRCISVQIASLVPRLLFYKKWYWSSKDGSTSLHTSSIIIVYKDFMTLDVKATGL